MSELPKYGRRMGAPPAEFAHVRDIEAFEGPVISEFRTNGVPFLFIWRDSNETYNRWLVVPTSDREIATYESRQTTLLRLVQRALGVYLTDADERGRFKRWWSLDQEEVPDEYLPGQDSFYDPLLRPATSGSQPQKILIEGHWTLDEIAKSARRLDEIYAAQSLLSDEGNARVRSDQPFAYKFKSGYVYHHFWQAMNRWVHGEAERDVKVNYNSPGVIQVPLDQELATIVVRAVRHLENNLDEIHENYRAIHTWVKYTKSDAPDEESDDRKSKKKRGEVPAVTDGTIKTALREFCAELGTISYERVTRHTGQDTLNAAEVVLSYYRRLRELALYEMQGRATLVTLDPSIPPPVRDEDVDAEVDEEAA